jgi:Conjugal transfer protein TraD
MTDVDVLPSDTSWLFEPTTGVHQFGGGSIRAIILGALLWMADKLKSNQGEQARALWAAKGKEAFAAERATDAPTISQETLQDRA